MPGLHTVIRKAGLKAISITIIITNVNIKSQKLN